MLRNSEVRGQVVDLEDRWQNNEWQKYLREQEIPLEYAARLAPCGCGHKRLPFGKPIEFC